MKQRFSHKTNLEEESVQNSVSDSRTKQKQKTLPTELEEQDEMVVIPTRLSEKIYNEAKDQVQELQTDQSHKQSGLSSFVKGSLQAKLAKLEDEDGSDDEDMGDFGVGEPPQERPMFADVVFEKVEKIKQNEAAELDPKIVKLYEGVGDIFSRYTQGKIPQAFRCIPILTNWEDALYLTRPDQWTAHAFLAATKIFINTNPRIAQKFMNRILLPHLRQEIERKQKLHLSLYETLKQCCQKAGAFYKGIIIPLCKSGTCTVREAVIFSSILKKRSLPIHHSAAALLCLAEMEYSGTTSFFIKTLIDKNYALPFKALDGMVEHFMRFEFEEKTIPVIWFQSFLAFVQHYKKRLKCEDLEDLRRLAKKQHHYIVSLEIYKEIDSVLRDEEDILMKDQLDPSENMNFDS